ncbi:MAG: SigF/SigG family RNA polymerase sporulation sigma factor [Lachnospiraceae bacterium]|nr:SigF/SigG family RNA polymerase sporulation sigma factor [Lachnospiraceae bacterium]
MEETTVLIERSQAGDKEAREVLVEKNLGLVYHIVKRFAGRGYDVEDLIQIGSIGLIKAIDKFDLSYDVKFSTYAVPMITGEIKRFLRDDGMIKMSRSIRENGWKIRAATEKLAQELGRDATVEEISKQTGIEVEDIIVSMEAGAEVESIYKTVYQGDGNEVFLVDKISSQPLGSSISGDMEKDKLLNHIVLEQLLNDLKEDERELIVLRYYQDKTQVEVAKKLGISQVQVSRLEKKILLRLRAYFT